jgi:isoquinoline 1-oxidoreductase beta subunit
VVQQSFSDYEVLRLHELPPFEVVIMPSIAAPGGAGEPAVPSVAPALCNALFAATGVRIRRLPLDKSGFTLA